jgi:hypothetical protein
MKWSSTILRCYDEEIYYFYVLQVTIPELLVDALHSQVKPIISYFKLFETIKSMIMFMLSGYWDYHL